MNQKADDRFAHAPSRLLLNSVTLLREITSYRANFIEIKCFFMLNELMQFMHGMAN